MIATMDRPMGHKVMMRRSTVFLLSGILAGAWVPPAGAAGSDEAGAQSPRVIEITASRFAFEPADIEVLVGESVQLVVHSSTAFPFRPWGFARRFRRMAPRSPSTSWRARRHQIACSVFCGAGHGGMSGVLSIVASAGGARPTDGPDQVADLEVDVLEPDFTLITLPTTLRLPQGKFAFRLTHRFSRSLADGRATGAWSRTSSGSIRAGHHRDRISVRPVARDAGRVLSQQHSAHPALCPAEHPVATGAAWDRTRYPGVTRGARQPQR